MDKKSDKNMKEGSKKDIKKDAEMMLKRGMSGKRR